MSTEVRPSNPVAQEIAAERARQIEAEGWDAAHDDEHEPGVLAQAAMVYARSAAAELSPRFIGPRMGVADAKRFGWPWDAVWWKPKGPRRDLIRAAALIVAEIERIDRAGIETKAEQR